MRGMCRYDRAHDDLEAGFNIEEAAGATGYSVDTICRAIRNNDLVARYANSKPIILVTELAEWPESLPAEPPSRQDPMKHKSLITAKETSTSRSSLHHPEEKRPPALNVRESRKC